MRIDNFSLFGSSANGLYIKYNKKLTLTINHLSIKTSKSKKQKKKLQIKRLLKKIDRYAKYINVIQINQLNINDLNTTLKITYDKQPKIEIKYLKNKNITLTDIAINYHNASDANISTTYILYGIKGQIKANLTKDILKYHLYSHQTTNITPLMLYLESLGVKKSISHWIYKKIKAKNYQINFIDGKLNIATNNLYLNDLIANIKTNNVEIYFQKNTQAIKAKHIEINIKNSTLYFKTNKGIFGNHTLTNPKIHIYNLYNKKAGINIRFDAYTKLDKSINNLLKTYHINLPVANTKNRVDFDLMLDIPFAKPIKVKYNGNVKSKENEFLFFDQKIKTKKLNINFADSVVAFKNSNFIFNRLIDIDVNNGKLNLKTKKAIFHSHLNKLDLGNDKFKIISIPNLDLDVALDINDGVKIDIPILQTKVLYKNHKTQILVNNTSTIANNSELLKFLDIDNANLNIQTKDFSSFDIRATVEHLGIVGLDDETINVKFDNTTMDIDIPNKLEIKTSSKHINVYGNNVTINLTRLLESKDDNKKILNASFTNSSFGYEKSLIKADTLTIKSKSIDNLELNTSYKTNHIYFKLDDTLKLRTNKLNDNYINGMLGKEAFANGEFWLYADGLKDDFNITFNFKNSIIKDLTVLNNIMAFINAVPSLVTFSNPNFSSTGYKTKKGTIKINIKNNIAYVTNINIKGASMNITGSGTMDLTSQELNLELHISFLNNLGKIISNIPIAGYIVLGDEENFGLSISVDGYLSNPNISSHLLKDTASAPVNIIKRVIITPFRLLKKLID